MTSTIATEASLSQTTPAAVAAQGAPSTTQANAKKKSSDGFHFSDLLDVINPLQHIPVVGTVYRELTGDTITPAAQIAGDALYGGLIGLASSVVNEVIEGTTGKDIGGHIWATVFGDDDDAASTKVASSTPSTSTPSAVSPSAAPTAGPDAIKAAEVPVTPLNGPTSFFQQMQSGTHHAKGVPLSTTANMGDTHHDGASALLQAQGPNGALSTQANQSAALGTSGIAASVNTPPPAIAPAPPPPNAAAAPAVQGNIADKMMQGLDAYKALALQQEKPAPSSAPTADTGGVSPTALIN